MAKNTICLWYDKDAEEAARFYSKTFPDSTMGSVLHAPSDFPSGKKGDPLLVEFTVFGIPCVGLNGGPSSSTMRLSPSRSPPKIRRRPTNTGTPSSAMAGRKCVRLVQGQMGCFMADHAQGLDRCPECWRRQSQTRLRGDDADAENRRRND